MIVEAGVAQPDLDATAALRINHTCEQESLRAHQPATHLQDEARLHAGRMGVQVIEYRMHQARQPIERERLVVVKVGDPEAGAEDQDFGAQAMLARELLEQLGEDREVFGDPLLM